MYLAEDDAGRGPPQLDVELAVAQLQGGEGGGDLLLDLLALRVRHDRRDDVLDLEEVRRRQQLLRGEGEDVRHPVEEDTLGAVLGALDELLDDEGGLVRQEVECGRKLVRAVDAGHALAAHRVARFDHPRPGGPREEVGRLGLVRADPEQGLAETGGG